MELDDKPFETYEDVGGLDDVIVYVAGGTVLIVEGKKIDERDNILKLLAERIPFENIKTYWNASDVAYSVLKLDVDTGEIEHETCSQDKIEL